MTDTALNVLYKQEFISAFEQRQSLVRSTVTTAADIKASSAVFLVAGSGNATAVTRGTNGLIPARALNRSQYTATLTEWHDLTRITGFNIYTTSGDARAIMQQDALAVMNRKIDDEIITELATATQDLGSTALPASLKMVMHAVTILGNNAVPLDGQISALITPAFHAYLMQTQEFSSADFRNSKPLESAMVNYRWAGVNFIVHPNLPGAGTSAEQCFVYHKSAIGHACNMANVEVEVGYDGEQGYSWARSSNFMGSKVLQNSGIVVINHDGSAFAAS